MKKTFLGLGLALALPSVAHASGCDEPKTGFDNVYCFAKVYMDLDRQLNDGYAALMRVTSPAQNQILREGQRGWILARNASCYRSQNRGNLVNINCALATTRRRIQFLSDRLAECRATGCNATKLRMVSEIVDE